MKKKIIIIIAILIVIAGVVIGYTIINRNKASIIQYKKEPIEKGDIKTLVVATGTLNPVTLVDVGSQVSGRIAHLYADFNSRVKEEEVLAQLDQSLFLTRVKQDEANYKSSAATLEKAKVNLKNIKKSYDRALDLFERALISLEEKEDVETQYYAALTDVQMAKARLEQAKAQLDSSKVDLAHTIIKSPINGIVISRNINVGQTVAASFQAPVLFQIANDLSKMQVECSVDEADIGKVKEGQKVKFTVDAFPDENFSGEVSQVRYSPEIVQNVVTYTTIVEVDNPEMKLRPGMTATVSVVVGEAKNKLLVPNSALRFTPQLSPEEMKEIVEEIRKERIGKRSKAGHQAGGPAAEKQRPQSGGQFAGRMGSGIQGVLRKDVSRVWVEDEKGKLRPIFIKTGITDNNYTEVIWGNLKEGQQVITGVESGSESSKSSRDSGSMRRMMRMVR